MSKKPREFEVQIVDLNDNEISILIDEKPIGFVKKNNEEFDALLNNQKSIGTFRSQDQAISSVISNFNLNS